MGFTDFPHAATSEAVTAAYAVLAADADLIVAHFDGGVPWPEAGAGAAYPPAVQAEIDFKVASVPAGHTVVLAITPIAFGRDDLAERWNATTNEPLPPPWDGYTFDAPEVIAAYVTHCRRMIDAFRPDHFCYAIEANMVRSTAPAQWSAFLALAAAVYDSVKADHPALPVFVSLQADWFHADRPAQEDAVGALLAHSDYVAVSSYPYADGTSDPAAVPASYFSDLLALGPGKPFAIAETAWPAEDLGDPYPILVPATAATQDAWLARVLAECGARPTVFLDWFFTRDFDDMWDATLSSDPGAPTFRIWRDCGLYDGAGLARPALQRWRRALAG